MIAAGGGSIINVSSIEGMRGAVWAHSYVASKWGCGLTKSAALELARKIQVNPFIRIHPHPMTKHLPDDIVTAPMGLPAPRRDRHLRGVPGQRRVVVLDGSEYVVDGGLICGVPHRAI